ncbi:hypothetical protein DIPPA_07013 [Diplonema papillatum]|nr:hypothetical protein DIPPA_07013 [Diplonema papillatum]
MSMITLMQDEGCRATFIRRPGDDKKRWIELLAQEQLEIRCKIASGECMGAGDKNRYAWYADTLNRRKAIRSLVRVHSGCKEKWTLPTLSRAIRFADSIISMNFDAIPTDDIPMLALACWWTTVKSFEPSPSTNISTSDILASIDARSSTAKFSRLEKTILNCCNYQLTTPEPVAFLRTAFATFIDFHDDDVDTPASAAAGHSDAASQPELVVRVSCSEGLLPGLVKVAFSVNRETPLHAALFPKIQARLGVQPGEVSYARDMAASGLKLFALKSNSAADVVTARQISWEATPNDLFWRGPVELFVCSDVKLGFLAYRKTTTVVPNPRLPGQQTTTTIVSGVPYQPNARLFSAAETLLTAMLLQSPLYSILAPADAALLCLATSRVYSAVDNEADKASRNAFFDHLDRLRSERPSHKPNGIRKLLDCHAADVVELPAAQPPFGFAGRLEMALRDWDETIAGLTDSAPLTPATLPASPCVEAAGEAVGSDCDETCPTLDGSFPSAESAATSPPPMPPLIDASPCTSPAARGGGAVERQGLACSASFASSASSSMSSAGVYSSSVYSSDATAEPSSQYPPHHQWSKHPDASFDAECTASFSSALSFVHAAGARSNQGREAPWY